MNILSLGSALPALPRRAVWSATASWPPLESRTPNAASIGHLAGYVTRGRWWSHEAEEFVRCRFHIMSSMSSWKLRRHSWIYRILNIVLYVCIYYNRPSSMDINAISNKIYQFSGYPIDIYIYTYNINGYLMDMFFCFFLVVQQPPNTPRTPLGDQGDPHRWGPHLLAVMTLGDAWGKPGNQWVSPWKTHG